MTARRFSAEPTRQRRVMTKQTDNTKWNELRRVISQRDAVALQMGFALVVFYRIPVCILTKADCGQRGEVAGAIAEAATLKLV
jgi:hypothetical protein